MLNIKYLTSGLLYNYSSQTTQTTHSIPIPIKNKKLEYYRLSNGFKDANNRYFDYKIKTNNFSFF